MSTLWLFLKTKVGRFLATLAAIMFSIAGAYLFGRRSGKATGEVKGDAKVAAAKAEDAQATVQVVTNATAAVQHIEAEAASAPAPDTVKRDDLDNTF